MPSPIVYQRDLERIATGPLVLRETHRAGYPAVIVEFEVWQNGVKKLVTSDLTEAREHFEYYRDGGKD